MSISMLRAQFSTSPISCLKEYRIRISVPIVYIYQSTYDKDQQQTGFKHFQASFHTL